MTYDEAIELAKKRKYNDGPPPDIGWWMTRPKDDPLRPYMRWWDGKKWSYLCTQLDHDQQTLDYWSKVYTEHSDNEMQWTDRFWEKRNA